MNNNNIFYTDDDLKKMKIVKIENLGCLNFDEYISLKINLNKYNKQKYLKFSEEIKKEYPYINTIEEKTIFYKNSDNKIIKEIKKVMKSKIPKIKTRKNIKPFGNISNNIDDRDVKLSHDVDSSLKIVLINIFDSLEAMRFSAR